MHEFNARVEELMIASDLRHVAHEIVVRGKIVWTQKLQERPHQTRVRIQSMLEQVRGKLPGHEAMQSTIVVRKVHFTREAAVMRSLPQFAVG